MAELWVDLLPVLLAMLISPARTLAVILLLHTPKRGATAFAYVLGMVSAMMVQGAALGLLMNVVGLTVERRGGDLSTVISILFVVTGIILLTGAAKFVLQVDDDDKAPPEWLAKAEVMSPAQAYKLGFGWLMVSPKQWVMVLTAVAVIFSAYLSPIASLVNFFIFTILVQTVFLIVIGIDVLIPERSQKILDALFVWIREHLRAVAITIFGLFGIFFVLKGLVGLVG